MVLIVTPLIGYSDADWGGCHDSRRSTTGTILMHHGGPIAWGSRRQSCVSQSTVEAEYVAASGTTKEAVSIYRILPDFQRGQEGLIIIKSDNQGAIQLARHPDQRQRTKHIDIRYPFIRSKQEIGEIDIQYIDTTRQLADILTKALPGPRFTAVRVSIGVLPVSVIG